MSSPFPSVADIIVSFIVWVMRLLGGQNLDWIQILQLAHFGSNRIRCRSARRV